MITSLLIRFACTGFIVPGFLFTCCQCQSSADSYLCSTLIFREQRAVLIFSLSEKASEGISQHVHLLIWNTTFSYRVWNLPPAVACWTKQALIPWPPCNVLKRFKPLRNSLNNRVQKGRVGRTVRNEKGEVEREIWRRDSCGKRAK